jgi:hypothetical protein
MLLPLTGGVGDIFFCIFIIRISTLSSVEEESLQHDTRSLSQKCKVVIDIADGRACQTQ